MVINGVEVPDAFLAVQQLLAKAVEVEDTAHRDQCIRQAAIVAEKRGLTVDYVLPKGGGHGRLGR
jgi:hypothetical protein